MEKFKAFSLIYIFYMFSRVADSKSLYIDCDHVRKIEHGNTTVISPGYPGFYDKNTACQYMFVAPLDHIIKANCTINIGEDNKGCTTGYFQLSRKGDFLLTDSDKMCGSHSYNFEIFNRVLVLAYESKGSVGKFRCELQVYQKCNCGFSSKIDNSKLTSIREYPSVVRLRDRARNDDIYCTGRIIFHRYILTTAYCTTLQETPALVAAEVGFDDLGNPTIYSVTYDIEEFIVHPLFAGRNTEYDIALFKTTTSIEWTKAVSAICLPPFTGLAKNLNYKEENLHYYHFPAINYNNSNDCKGAFPIHLIYQGNRQYFLGIRKFYIGCDKPIPITNIQIIPLLSWIYESTNNNACNAD